MEREMERERGAERMGRWPEWHWGLRWTCQKRLALPFADSRPGPTGIIGTIDLHFFLMSATDSLTDISSCGKTATDRRNEWRTQAKWPTDTKASYFKLLPTITFGLDISTAKRIYILCSDILFWTRDGQINTSATTSISFGIESFKRYQNVGGTFVPI